MSDSLDQVLIKPIYTEVSVIITKMCVRYCGPFKQNGHVSSHVIFIIFILSYVSHIRTCLRSLYHFLIASAYQLRAERSM